MPKVNTTLLKTKLTDSEFAIAKQIIKPDSTIKIAKPNADGLTQYVWRMVVFQVSPLSQHQCMPALAFCYIPAKYGTEEYKILEKIGNKIADAIVDSVNILEWHGIRRWAEVL